MKISTPEPVLWRREDDVVYCFCYCAVTFQRLPVEAHCGCVLAAARWR